MSGNLPLRSDGCPGRGACPIGFITTLSTPAGYLGEDSRDGFQLAIDQEGGKLGGVPVQLIVEDDGLQPAKAKQIADRMSLDGISLYTGVILFQRAGGRDQHRHQGRFLRQQQHRALDPCR